MRLLFKGKSKVEQQSNMRGGGKSKKIGKKIPTIKKKMKNVFFSRIKGCIALMFFMGLNVPGIGVRKAVWHLRKSFHMCGSTEGNYGLPIDNLNGCRNGQKWRR